MLRLLFSTAAILPIAVIPWLTDEGDALADVPVTTATATSASLDADPALAALADCTTEELPVFFHDSYVTLHSADYVHQGLDAAAACGAVDITIVPVLPANAAPDEADESRARTAELAALIDAIGLDARVAEASVAPSEALFLNGQAALLRIEPIPVNASAELALAVEQPAP